MDADRLLRLARELIGELTFCVASTHGKDGGISAQIV